MIRIPISYLHKDDKISLLPDDSQKAAWKTIVDSGLKSDDPEAQLEAEALKGHLDLCEEAEGSEHAKHYIAVFREPSWSDKPAIAAEAIRLAEDSGSREAANMYAYPLRVTRLLSHVEDTDGKDVAVKLPESIYEYLGRKLDPHFNASASLTDFFTPKGAASAKPAAPRKPKCKPAK